MHRVKVGTFTKSTLIEIARLEGYFLEDGIEVEEITVSSSPEQFELLMKGLIDVAITSPDNVIAYQYLENNPLGQRLNVRILGALDRGLGLSLCVVADLLRAPTSFGVDVPNSGFAFLGYELLAQEGFPYGSYEIKVLGSTPKRRVALIDKRVDCTILNAGNEINATSQGAKKIADLATVGPYLGTVLSVLGEPDQSARQFQQVINRVATEVLAGLHATAILSVVERNLSITPQGAREHYEVMLSPVHGLVADGLVDTPSLENLIRLRSKYLPDKDLDRALLNISTLVSPGYLK